MVSMDLLRHLKFFVAVAEEGHFGNAATRLGMTQPPLSQGVRRLEDRLGSVLVDRGGRRIGLTDAGRQLLPRARLLVADAARFEDEALRIAGGRHSVVRWGTTASITDEVVLECIGALVAVDSEGEPKVETTTAATADLVESVTSGLLDVALIEHPALLTDVASGPVLQLRRWVIVPSGHPVASAKRPQARMFRGLALSTGQRSDNPAAHDLFVDGWRARGLDPELIVSNGSRELLAQVAAGRCFGVTARPPASMPGVAWVEFAPDALALRVRTICRRGSDAALLARALDRVIGGARP